MKWSIVIVMISMLAIHLWGHGGFDGMTLETVIENLSEFLDYWG